MAVAEFEEVFRLIRVISVVIASFSLYVICHLVERLLMIALFSPPRQKLPQRNLLTGSRHTQFGLAFGCHSH